MSRTPLLSLNSQSVQAFFLRIFRVNSPDLLNEKWIIIEGISSNILFSGLLQILELIASVLSPLSHYVSGPRVRFALLALVASIEINSNMSESLRHLCHHHCVHCVNCVTYLPLYVFHCAKIDSVQTQWKQGKKRIVGARL